MGTKAKAAFGVTLSRGSDLVAEILELGNIKFERDFIDVTNHASPGGYEEFIPSAIIKTGELTIKCNSIISDTAHAGMKSDWTSKTASTYTITFPDGSTFTGSAIVTAYEYESPLTEQIKLSVTLKWTGAVTEATASATAPSDLVIATADLTPAFSGAAYEYYAVSTGDTCTITLTFATSTAKLYRGGVFVQNLTSATASGSLSLGVDGTVTDFQIVVSEAAKSDRIYNLHVINAAA